MDADPISSLKGLGPAMEAMLARAGIADVGTLREIGADEAYARVLRDGARPHFIAYYVLEMALQGRPWNDCKGDEKAALRVRFDRIRASAFDVHRDAFEAAMDAIGVIDAP